MATYARQMPQRKQLFEALYTRSQRRAYNLAYRLTGNATEAEDITQDAFVRAWNNFEHYDSARPFEGWLFRIITNRVIDMRRRQKRVPIYSIDAPLPSDPNGQPLRYDFAAPEANPEERLMNTELAEPLQKALSQLPEDYRQAIFMCDIYGHSYQEIAEEMGCAIGTVRSRIHRARVILRKQMSLSTS
jgi:RNA polymerase sigma-70 factor (ECF subfamily)